jgi:hypothetical protein
LGASLFYKTTNLLTAIIYTAVLKDSPFGTVGHPSPSLLASKGFASANEGKSAASYCQQVAALVPDMFCNFYIVKNHKMAKNSTTANARQKISTDIESLDF